MIFNYFIRHEQYGILHSPLLNIRLKNPKNSKSFNFDYPCLVDSGAAACVFHAGIGDVIGLKVKKEKKIPLRGILPDAGTQYLHDVIIVIREMGIEFKTKVGFTYDFAKDLDLIFPWGILGQNGFFDGFKIKFDLQRRIFEIK